MPAADPARPLKRRAAVASAFLALSLVTAVVNSLAEANLLGVLDQLERGVDVSFEDATAADERSADAALAQLVVYVATVIAFLAWFWRAYRNLPGLGIREPRFRSGWAIGAWFVPILNLFRPKQIANDIWRATAPDALANGWRSYRGESVSGLLHAWWALWLLADFGGRLTGRLYLNSDSISSQQNAAYVSIVTDVLYAIAAVLAILVIRAITRRYEDRRAELAS